MPLERLMVAPADFVLSLTEVAVSVTVVATGMVAGELYVVGLPLEVAAGDTEPQVEQAAEAWLRVQLTPALAESFPTVAVNGREELSGIRALTGETETVIAGTVTEAVAVAPLKATEVAVTVTARSAGGGAGALYVFGVPLAVGPAGIEPHGAGAQETVQVTPLLVGSLLTVAVNGSVLVPSTLAVEGATVTCTPRTCIVPDAEMEELAVDVAVKVTVRPAKGGEEGAVYVVATPFCVALGERDPQGAGEQERVHVNTALAGPFNA